MPRKPMDLDGRTFGSLTVDCITDTRNTYGRLLYQCHCVCGRTVYTTAANLVRGDIVACPICRSLARSWDLSGTRFGQLVAVEPINPPTKTQRTWGWRCRCDCGRDTVVRAGNLLSGKTVSCGCAQETAVKSLYVDGTAPCKLSESGHPRATNTSGVTGVYYDKARNMYSAEIVFKRKKYYLGRYVDLSDAASARKLAEENLFGDFLKWYVENKANFKK